MTPLYRAFSSWPGLTRPSRLCPEVWVETLLGRSLESVRLDGRVKPGHDNGEWVNPKASRYGLAARAWLAYATTILKWQGTAGG